MSSFSDRFAFLSLDDGGVIVDLTNGNYLALNRSAAAVCTALGASTDLEVVAKDVGRRLGIGPEEASRAVDDVRRGLETPPPPTVNVGPFGYERAADGQGYVLMHAGHIRLAISPDGTRVVVSTTPTSKGQLYEYLRAAAPKILFLRGATVLHGSAFRLGLGLRAICGASGAGKTTTGRTFGATGRMVISEDLLVLSSVSPPRVYVDGERRVHAWAREVTEQIAAGGARTVETTELGAALSGDDAPIDEIWFIEAAHRHNDADGSIRLRSLTRTEGAVFLMNAIFLGTASPSGWRRFLSDVDKITSSVVPFEAVMPNGVERLEAAVRAYSENSAS